MSSISANSTWNHKFQVSQWTRFSVASSAGPSGIIFWQMVWGLPACAARGDYSLNFSVSPTHLNQSIFHGANFSLGGLFCIGWLVLKRSERKSALVVYSKNIFKGLKLYWKDPTAVGREHQSCNDPSEQEPGRSAEKILRLNEGQSEVSCSGV